MFGSLLSSVVKVATSPLDIANKALDVATGGSGSNKSRTKIPLSGDLEKMRDSVAETLKECDE